MRISLLPARVFCVRAVATVSLAVCILAAAQSQAADPDLSSNGQHRLFSAQLPAGVLGQARALGRGPIAGYFQPVAFSGPSGVQFSLAQGGQFIPGEDSLMAGLLIGSVYRFRITGIPFAVGAELYPSVEVIDRTYPPPQLATSYPIPINLDQEDLEAALDGQLVTRVIYLEDPQTALAVAETPTTSRAVDVAEYQDALEVADRLGRPVAVVRIGSLTPPQADALLPQFFFGHPAWAPIYQPDQIPTQP